MPSLSVYLPIPFHLPYIYTHWQLQSYSNSWTGTTSVKG